MQNSNHECRTIVDIVIWCHISLIRFISLSSIVGCNIFGINDTKPGKLPKGCRKRSSWMLHEIKYSNKFENREFHRFSPEIGSLSEILNVFCAVPTLKPLCITFVQEDVQPFCDSYLNEHTFYFCTTPLIFCHLRKLSMVCV